MKGSTPTAGKTFEALADRHGAGTEPAARHRRMLPAAGGVA